jgi:hypothetical protein
LEGNDGPPDEHHIVNEEIADDDGQERLSRLDMQWCQILIYAMISVVIHENPNHVRGAEFQRSNQNDGTSAADEPMMVVQTIFQIGMIYCLIQSVNIIRSIGH